MQYKQNTENVAAEKFDGEFVLINFARGTYFSLRNAAVDVWQQFENGATPEAVGARIAAHFSVAGDAVQAELERCIGTLIEEELICETDAPGPAVEGWSSQAYEAPVVEVYSDLQDLIILDPVHEVDDAIGWPRRPPERDGA